MRLCTALMGAIVLVFFVAGCVNRHQGSLHHDGSMFAASCAYATGSSAGLGLDPNQTSLKLYPMAFAVYASSLAIVAARTEDASYRLSATEAVDWLVGNSDLNCDGLAGWGLPFAWDASQDGSINPAHTVYGITTALAIKALLDVHELTGVHQYIDVAEQALDAYSSYYTSVGDSSGYLWYSQWPEDANPFPNVIAMLAGMYARAGAALERDDFTGLALSCAEYLLDSTINDAQGVHWPYRVGRAKPNDAVHAAYVVEGLLEISQHCDLAWDIESSLDYLEEFRDDDYVNRFINYTTGPARAWGIGYLMYVLCLAGRCEAAEAFLPALATYEFSPGLYGHTPGMEILYPRFHTHILIALAECGF